MASEKIGIFELEQKNRTLIVIPTLDLRELDYLKIEEGTRWIPGRVDDKNIRNIVLV